MIKITLKDGSQREYENNTSFADITKSISPRLLEKATCVKSDGKIYDLRAIPTADCSLEILTFDDNEGKGAYWHTASHILAQAILRLIPDAKLTIGPSIDNGFYYDIDSNEVISEEMIAKLEIEMKNIAKEKLEISAYSLSKEEALDFYKDNEYKTELINELLEGETISFYKQGDFTDLCAGPHLLSTAPIGAVKILSVAGAYWRGNSENKMLTRIYATAYPKQKQLDEYLHLLEEAKKRDHKKLGRELKLFEFSDYAPGFPFFLPKGMTIYNELLDYWREVHLRRNYYEINTPVMLNRQLWETSGHWYHYKENMYTSSVEDVDFAIKPMNCPGGMLVYKMEPHSYKEFPLRMGEIGHVHRYELSGALNGLMRVRSFRQDDAHIFMTPEQITEVILETLNLYDEVYSKFGLTYKLELSTRPEDSMGSEEQWDIATEGLRKALEAYGADYKVNEGDGAFYGPKIDFQIQDALGRQWQCGTIQLDMQLPERFELEYTGADGEKHRPVMIHRALFGSIERFIGILTEHFAGVFPLWLAPTQAVIIPVSETHKEYAHKVANELAGKGIRILVDDRNEKMGYRIRENQLQKVPYMLIVGDNEANNFSVSVRDRKEEITGEVKVSDFKAMLMEKVYNRSL